MAFILGWLLLFSIKAPGPWLDANTAHFQLRYPLALEKTAQDLKEHLEPIRSAILADLSAPDPGAVLVILAPDRETFFALQPPGVPNWASGTSYPGARTIFLKPLDAREIRANTLPGIFAHELAHLILRERLRGTSPPRWLDEGIANRYGRSLSWDFPGPLMEVGITGNFIPWADLADGFPETGPQAHLAYAQSTDFIQFLIKTYGPAAFARFLDRLAAGEELDPALTAGFGRDLAPLSAAWQRRVRWTYGLIGLLTGGITLWFAMAWLLIWAYARKRKTSRLRKELWDLEDRAAAEEHSAPDPEESPPETRTYH